MTHDGHENGHLFVTEAAFRILELRVDDWETIMNQRSGELEHRQITRDAEIRRDIAQIRRDIGDMRAEMQSNYERLMDALEQNTAMLKAAAPPKRRGTKK